MKTRIKDICIPVMLLLFTLTASHKVMATNVSGTIVNGNWTSNNSPYVVVGNINIAGLTIYPGVTVSFATNYAFEVDGVLTANGTPNAPIVFKGTNGGWQGIFFNYSSPGSVLANCIISNSVNSGVSILSSTPLITGCVIANNSAPANGGGIQVSNLSGGDIILQNCTISNNMVGGPFDGSLSGDVKNGGGVFAQLSGGTLKMIGCHVVGNVVNKAWANFGYFQGGGIFVNGGAVLSFCVVNNNQCYSEHYCGYAVASASGGGLYSDSGTTVLNNCIISGNNLFADQGTCPAYVYGGGVYAYEGSLSMTNCIVGSNTATSTTSEHGGGIYISSQLGNASIVNCTIAYNNIEGLGSDLNTAQTMNSIFYFNNANGTQIIGTTNVTYCDVQNGVAGTGNINHNPIFLSTSDLIIVPGSPCINAGNTNAIYNNVYFPPSLGVGGNDIGANGGPGAGGLLSITLWPPIEVFFYGGVPGYSYLFQATTNLSSSWQTVESFQITNMGDIADFLEPSTNTLPQRFYKLNLSP
jgi:hypothetical protein